jgi:hypothetical protein
MPTPLTAADFLAADHTAFEQPAMPARAWELVDGQPTPLPAHDPDAAALVANLAALLYDALRHGLRDRLHSAVPGATLRVEIAVPVVVRADTVRVPDVLIRRDGRPVVLCVIVDPEAVDPADRRRRLADLRQVEGVEEVLEVHPRQPTVHALHLEEGRWRGEVIGGIAALRLRSIDVVLSVGEIYECLVQPAPAPR